MQLELRFFFSLIVKISYCVWLIRCQNGMSKMKKPDAFGHQAFCKGLFNSIRMIPGVRKD
jgi:hypothetical protein